MIRFVVRPCAIALAIAVLLPANQLHAEFIPIAGWDQQLFPSYLVATAAIRLPDETEEEADEETTDDACEQAEVLGDSQGVLGVELESPGEDVPVKVTIHGSAIFEPSTYTGTLADDGATYQIYPSIKYKYSVLARNRQSVPVSVTFRVEVGDEEPEEQTVTLILRSINDCPFAIVHDEDNVEDVSYMFAAYVNEQHPFVDKVLREALNGDIVDSFTGYQSGDAATVYRQVYALWNALSQRDVRYSNITASAANNNEVYSQHVRLIDESINNAQANCVDGSVLLASLPRKIDIEPVLIFVPGHCFVGFYLDAEGKQLVALETTLIGSALDEVSTVDGLEDVADETWNEQNSWRTFNAAIAMGNEELSTNSEKFEDESEAAYQIIPIADARKLGILPIAFDSNGKFEASTWEAE